MHLNMQGLNAMSPTLWKNMLYQEREIIRKDIYETGHPVLERSDGNYQDGVGGRYQKES